jgi:hypothetical protein
MIGASSRPAAAAMSPKLNEALTDAVRSLGRATTPADLQRRGVAKLRSISLTEVAGLIERAVNRTLIARTLGKVDDGIESFSQATRHEFIEMMRAGTGEKREVEREAENELARLKRELHKRRLEAKVERAQAPPQDSEARRASAAEDELRALFGAWRNSPDGVWKLESSVIELVQKALQAEREQRAQEQQSHQLSDVDRLERRVAKLSRLLGTKERELAQLVKAKNFEDAGVSSLVFDVGLSENDENFAAKSGLLTQIFDANFKLQERD